MIAAGVLACSTGVSGTDDSPLYQPYATFQNFVVPDPLFGNNGLPYSPSLQMNYGPVGHLMDSDGNELEGIEECILWSEKEGKYYYYASSYAFGTFFHAPMGDNYLSSVTPLSPQNAYFRTTSISIYESDDLMNWRFIDRWVPLEEDGTPFSAKKPRVIYCPNTDKYVMWIEYTGGGNYQGLVISEAKRPEGPWSRIRDAKLPAGKQWRSVHPSEGNVILGENEFPSVSHDHDLILDPDGRTGYIECAAMTNNYIYKLNDSFDGVVEYSTINIADDVEYRIHGGSGLFHRDGWWYLVGSPTCGNCIAAETRYIRARDPMGPWEEPDTGLQDTAGNIKPKVISWDSGHAQSKGVMKLPDINGNLHFFMPFCHYNSSPGGAPSDDSLAQSGDNNLALNGNCWIPLEFNETGHILPLKFEPTAKFPLAKYGNFQVPPVYQADGSITDKSSIVQTFKRSSGTTFNTISIGVFQRAPDETPGDIGKGLYGTTGSQDPMLNVPLQVELKLPNGKTETWDVDPYQIAWSIMSVPLILSEPCSCTGEFTLTLSTTADNGCYGVAVGAPSFLTLGGSYSHKLKSGVNATYANAAMYFTLGEAEVVLPKITEQPESVTLTAVGNNTYMGFIVKTDTVAGVGFDWEVNRGDGAGWVDYTIPDETYPNENYGPFLRLGPITDALKTHYAGYYRVRVFNNKGEVYSDVVTLNVPGVTLPALD
jgi:hypothetical protein